uniref:Reverse transcriptase Ty1/copia-type domain-containing protein n=1 Tax=Tanacetum cinerariifolium TaxID=118510 RepID=A0A699IZR5_TANCI|nr:hypothetical protein [Tanacetum cinerariifolium]
MGFNVYQMDVKSAFRTLIILTRFTKRSRQFMDYIKLLELGMKLWPTIFWKMVFKEDLCKAFEKLMKDVLDEFNGELTFFLGLQVEQKKDGIFISHDKYVDEILWKFGLTDGKSAYTPIDTEKALLKDPDGEDADVHTYRSMIDSLMYLTSSRPDIMFAVCACARFQVTPKALHIHEQTVIATSSTEAEYVAAASCCAQVLWIQNQLLVYGICKGFSRVETPLFKGMIVEQQVAEGDDDEVHAENVKSGAMFEKLDILFW